MSVPAHSIILLIFATLCGAFGGILLKKSAASFSFNPFKLIRNKNFIEGVLLYVFSIILFIPALKGNELSLIYPLTSFSYIWVTIFSAVLLKERIDFKKIFGIGMIILGIIIITAL